MARYFFHIMNGKAVIDDVGVELPDLASVRNQAIVSAGQMLSAGDQQWSGDAWRMIVADDNHSIVFSVAFSTDDHGL